MITKNVISFIAIVISIFQNLPLVFHCSLNPITYLDISNVQISTVTIAISFLLTKLENKDGSADIGVVGMCTGKSALANQMSVSHPQIF